MVVVLHSTVYIYITRVLKKTKLPKSSSKIIQRVQFLFTCGNDIGDMNGTCVLPAFEWCTVDTIMVVAVGCPATNDCVEAEGTSVP